MVRETVALHESKGSDKVVKFIDLESFTAAFQYDYNNNIIHGCFYDDDGNIVAQDIWDEIHTDILTV